MAAYDEKMVHLLEIADHAVGRAGELDESLWTDPEVRKRLNDVLAYARLVIARSDGALVSHSAGSGVEATLTELVNAPEQIATEFETWLERLLDQLARLPMAHDRDFEQEAKDAAATFQRSAQQRLSALEREYSSTRQEAEARHAKLEEMNAEQAAASEARLQELRQAITDADTTFKERLQGYETNLETERGEGLKQRGEQAEAFQAAQAERASRAEQILAGFETELHDRSAAALESLEQSRSRAAELVDLVATSSTAGAFGNEARDQKGQADNWRKYAIWLGLAAAAIAAFAVVYAAVVETKPALIAAKVALAAVLVGLAGYAAKQSAEHRNREVRARRLELELTAFGPFTEGLKDPDEEKKVRAELIERIFVGDPGLDGSTPALTGGDISLVAQLADAVSKFVK